MERAIVFVMIRLAPGFTSSDWMRYLTPNSVNLNLAESYPTPVRFRNSRSM
ncbi:hypothetical protein PSTT_04725 [Puccinia striiformis]|uniref:Uncharacterized protein n=1 Tax=Puccinia striiformis TaxID=27350 RepID=A0A2S4VRV5_9BASI|nr:hypothetical protein PSTT_04725 [Puccinia striiformis]